MRLPVLLARIPFMDGHKYRCVRVPKRPCVSFLGMSMCYLNRRESSVNGTSTERYGVQVVTDIFTLRSSST